MATKPSYRIGIDIGGTFTDIVAGARRRAGGNAQGAIDAGRLQPRHRRARSRRGSARLAGGRRNQVIGIVHATTVATNAILEFKGARTGLLTTAGFRDVLEMRRLRIPVLYDLQYEKPTPLVPRRLRLEVRERMGPRRHARAPLIEERDVAGRGRGLPATPKSRPSRSASCMPTPIPPTRSRPRRSCAKRWAPGVYICRGSEILPEIREYERTSTAVVNAYIGPVMQQLRRRARRRGSPRSASRAPIEMMHSGGGIMRLRRR